MKIAVDWDDTLVDVHTQEWLPGALDRLRKLAAEHDVFVHTCRANWLEGHASVEAKLAGAGLHLEVVGKPLADVYIDDRAEKPDWMRRDIAGHDARADAAARLSRSEPIPRLSRGARQVRNINGIVVY